MTSALLEPGTSSALFAMVAAFPKHLAVDAELG
jgi:hypothetical protein